MRRLSKTFLGCLLFYYAVLDVIVFSAFRDIGVWIGVILLEIYAMVFIILVDEVSGIHKLRKGG